MHKTIKTIIALIIGLLILAVINPFHKDPTRDHVYAVQEADAISQLRSDIYDLSIERESKKDLTVVVLDNRTITLPCGKPKVYGYDKNRTVSCGFPEKLSLVDINGSLQLTNNEGNITNRYEFGLFQSYQYDSLSSRELPNGKVKIIGRFTRRFNDSRHWLYNPEDGTIMFYQNGVQTDFISPP